MKKVLFLTCALSLAMSSVANAQSSITALALEAQFEANNLRAEKVYSGKTYEVSGMFKGAEMGLFGAAQGAYVTLEGPEDSFSDGFHGHLAKGEEDAAMNLNKGQNVRLRCVLGGSMMGTPTGEDCHLIR
jgi:opacity protein-like surface antigen